MQLAKKRLYSLGEEMGKDLLREECGGGERPRKVKSLWMYWEWRTQEDVSGLCWRSRRVWRRESSERRKKPRRDGSGEEEVTETAEMAMETWPVWVKPNFSKRIMERVSEVIVRVLISAVAKPKRRRKKTARTTVGGILVIVTAVVAEEEREELREWCDWEKW